MFQASFCGRQREGFPTSAQSGNVFQGAVRGRLWCQLCSESCSGLCAIAPQQWDYNRMKTSGLI